MRKFIKRLKNERGLTLVELLAVIVILGIIAIIAFVFIGGIIENSKKDAHIANAQQAISAAKLHEATGGGFGEDGTQSEGSISIEELQKQDYLDVMHDPWTKEPYTTLNTGEVTIAPGEAGDGEGMTTVYSISFSSSDSEKCNINSTEVGLTSGDRDALCDGQDPSTD